MTKAELRDRIRRQKRSMTDSEIEEKSAHLVAQFLASRQYRNAKTLYSYLSFNQEVRTLPILEQALKDGKRVALPKCDGKEMRFIYLSDLTQVQKSSIGAPEPMADGPVGDDETALVLVPGLAFDKNGYRVGYGGGYYDKFLSREPRHPTVALCFDFQILEQLPVEAYDIPADLILWA